MASKRAATKRHVSRIARQAKHIELLSAAGLSAVFAFLLWIATEAPTLIASDYTTGVSSSILLVSIFLAFGAWVIGDTTRTLRSKGFKPFLFWSTYIACFWPLLLAWLLFKSPYGLDIQIIFTVTAIHFVVVSLLISLLYAAKLSVVSRFIIMVSVIIAAYVLSILLSVTRPI